VNVYRICLENSDRLFAARSVADALDQRFVQWCEEEGITYPNVKDKQERDHFEGDITSITNLGELEFPPVIVE